MRNTILMAGITFGLGLASAMAWALPPAGTYYSKAHNHCAYVDGSTVVFLGLEGGEEPGSYSCIVTQKEVPGTDTTLPTKQMACVGNLGDNEAEVLLGRFGSASLKIERQLGFTVGTNVITSIDESGLIRPIAVFKPDVKLVCPALP